VITSVGVKSCDTTELLSWIVFFYLWMRRFYYCCHLCQFLRMLNSFFLFHFHMEISTGYFSFEASTNDLKWLETLTQCTVCCQFVQEHFDWKSDLRWKKLEPLKFNHDTLSVREIAPLHCKCCDWMSTSVSSGIVVHKQTIHSAGTVS